MKLSVKIGFGLLGDIIFYAKTATELPITLPPYSFTDGGNFIIAKGRFNTLGGL